MSIKNSLSLKKLKEYLRYRWLPRLVDFKCYLEVRRAAKNIATQGSYKVLIDNATIAHGVTHETARVYSGKQKWGDIEIESYTTARIPVHDDRDDGDAARSVRYLPGIASLARGGHISLYISDELLDEQWTQPVGRFRGNGIFDFNLFSKVKLQRIPDPDYRFVVGPSHLGYKSLKEQRKKRLEAKSDSLYQDLLQVLGKNNSQDIWHIVTAERNDCYCFLTMDFRLIRNLKAQRNNPVVASLKTKVLTPEDFGIEFGIPKISPRMYSYHGASFPVRSDLNWPDSRRQRPSRDKQL